MIDLRISNFIRLLHCLLLLFTFRRFSNFRLEPKTWQFPKNSTQENTNKFKHNFDTLILMPKSILMILSKDIKPFLKQISITTKQGNSITIMNYANHTLHFSSSMIFFFCQLILKIEMIITKINYFINFSLFQE